MKDTEKQEYRNFLSNLSDKELEQLRLNEDKTKVYNNAVQMAYKIGLLNSAYGALLNKHYRWNDPDLGESITKTGQMAVQWVMRNINEYINKQAKTEGVDYCIAGDTDSVVGNSIIEVNGRRMTIEEYFNTTPNNYLRNIGDDVVKVIKTDDKTPSFDCLNQNIEKNKRIKYVKRHMTAKRLYRIYDKINDTFVVVTEDHSIIVRDKVSNTIKSIKPKDLAPEYHEIINVS